MVMFCSITAVITQSNYGHAISSNYFPNESTSLERLDALATVILIEINEMPILLVGISLVTGDTSYHIY